MGGGARAGATFGRCGNLKIRTISGAPPVGFAGIPVELSGSLPFFFLRFQGAPQSPSLDVLVQCFINILDCPSTEAYDRLMSYVKSLRSNPA